MKDQVEYRKEVQRFADKLGAFGALAGGLLIDNDWRVAGWILLFMSVGVLFQRISDLLTGKA